MYINMMYRPLRWIADRFNTLQMGLVASERVFDLLDRDDHIENKGELRPEKVAGKIEFDHVVFGYNEGEEVLKDVSFTVEPGETLAIVGSTGSGKTTIINLLNRFYEINSGAIRVDGKDIRDFELNALREAISIVLQDVFLFSGSIEENISLQDQKIGRDEIEAAAKMIGADSFIQHMPGGYDYQVMERGATLSLGQRQLHTCVHRHPRM